MRQIITSLLDTDLYIFPMGQAVFRLYDRLVVGYELINRDKRQFPQGFAQKLREQISLMANIHMTTAEKAFLEKRCGHYLRPGYIDWLFHYRFDPSEVTVTQEGGDLSVAIHGVWYRTIYWEVPLMALISELYFEEMGFTPASWFRERAFEKGRMVKEAGLRLIEFGTRRRHSLYVQGEIIQQLKNSAGEFLVGTSNVMLAMEFDLPVVGTHAHQWFQAHAGMFGYRMATQKALEAWAKEFEGSLGIALTDTYTSDVFFKEFGAYYSKLFDGVRQDSGDPFSFVQKAIAHYRSFGIDPVSKRIVFSDSLTIQKAIQLLEYCKGRIQCLFGIGTHLTNDVGHLPLNIVIKMMYIIRIEEPERRIFVPKLSDDPGKTSGSSEDVHAAQYELGLVA